MIFIFFHHSWFSAFCQFSTVQHGDPVTHTCIHSFFSHYHAETFDFIITQSSRFTSSFTLSAVHSVDLSICTTVRSHQSSFSSKNPLGSAIHPFSLHPHLRVKSFSLKHAAMQGPERFCLWTLEVLSVFL